MFECNHGTDVDMISYFSYTAHSIMQYLFFVSNHFLRSRIMAAIKFFFRTVEVHAS